jgi:hypothetical protein
LKWAHNVCSLRINASFIVLAPRRFLAVPQHKLTTAPGEDVAPGPPSRDGVSGVQHASGSPEPD